MFIRLEEYRRYLLWKATNRRGGDGMKCELCGEEAYGMIDGLVAICWDCDTSCGSFEPSAEVTA